MLPSGWIEYLGGKRNDEMIFIWMNFVFAANMIMNAAWLPVFQSNTQWGFIVGWLLLVGIWVTNTYLMVVSERFNTWWLEVLMVRLPFSIYSGWVTGATVLNTAYALKSMGMTDSNVQKNDTVRGIEWWGFLKPLMFISEEEWTIIAAWTVVIFFEIVAWWERNPAWGAVYVWASTAILIKNI